jgi:acetyltransferase-like isoleucine patch superfamily enzyme
VTPESPFYSSEELAALGCTSIGRRVQISRLARFYGFHGELGDNCRIDDYCVVKGRVDIGCYVHISAFCLLGGTGGRIAFGDFSTTAAYVALHTASDDYASPLLTNAVVPPDLRQNITGDIVIGKGVILGTHCVVLPESVVGDYATIGALCIVNGDYAPGVVYVTGAGRPRSIGRRDMADVEKLEAEARRRLDEAPL